MNVDKSFLFVGFIFIDQFIFLDYYVKYKIDENMRNMSSMT